MKKHLIAAAVAAMASTGAYAQVTVSGLLDFAYGNVKQDGQSSERTVSTRDLTSATSVINIIAVEDLGGGMKATAKYGLDPRVLANDNNKQATDPTRTFARDELFVGIEGGFGNVRLGSPNSIGLTTFLSGTPFGTGVGGGYAALALDYSFIRHDRSMRYDSPNFNGLTFAVLHAPGADAAVGTIVPTNGPVNEFGVGYAAGALTVAFANVTQPSQLTNVKTSSNILSANYKLGNTTLYAGWNDGDQKSDRTAPTTASKGSRVAVKHSMGAIDILAGYAEQKNGAVKETVTGLRADYNLSKSTATYAAYENYDNGAAANPNRSIMSIGLRKAF